tara:strand:- start:1027 stop:1365 length:339 start_codon:yes stop_codon:yes gene_type:complete
MNPTTIIVYFTGFSFVAYGINSFVSKRMKNEFKRWGLEDKRKIIGICQFIAGTGIILGSEFKTVLISSAIFIIIMMIVAIGVRIRIRDDISDILPAIAYIMLCLVILYETIK